METNISEERGDHVTIRIDEKLALLSSSEYSTCCIYRIDDLLRNENEKAYEPVAVAIGPYHRDKNNLKAMEEHKIRYLKQVLQLSDESSTDRYVMAMRNLEGRARNFYPDSINLTNDEFVEMMLLDGCFVIQFLWNWSNGVVGDPLMHQKVVNTIALDLLLYENQIPLFVLNELLNTINWTPYNPKFDIMHVAKDCFGHFLRPISEGSETVGNVDHLLGFIHERCYSSFAKVLSQERQKRYTKEMAFIKCATELQEAGVKIKRSCQPMIFMFDIKFENGVLEIPQLDVYDSLERLLRNLIAYEQFSPGDFKNIFTSYAVFMDSLINTEKDAQLLRHEGVIVNWMGDDKVVSTMFNKLCTFTVLCENYYPDVVKNLNKHCGQRRHIWLANLRRNYFNSPWSSISFSAAALLLLLTVMQTILSFLAYYK